ncbi:MAG: PilZ domain-containing protein, partial [Candidatus Hydrogenedentes bacterium]|nr:PilZ domain-containing protein [Candidatus Hydrogenedentota bacterium]
MSEVSQDRESRSAPRRERRGSRRQEMACPVLMAPLRGPGWPVVGTVRDISCSGARIRATQPVIPGTELDLEFQFSKEPAQQDASVIRGRAVRFARVGDHEHEISVEFKEGQRTKQRIILDAMNSRPDNQTDERWVGSPIPQPQRAISSATSAVQPTVGIGASPQRSRKRQLAWVGLLCVLLLILSMLAGPRVEDAAGP